MVRLPAGVHEGQARKAGGGALDVASFFESRGAF